VITIFSPANGAMYFLDHVPPPIVVFDPSTCAGTNGGVPVASGGHAAVDQVGLHDVTVLCEGGPSASVLYRVAFYYAVLATNPLAIKATNLTGTDQTEMGWTIQAESLAKVAKNGSTTFIRAETGTFAEAVDRYTYPLDRTGLAAGKYRLYFTNSAEGFQRYVDFTL
jgi:hypothetical protein